jgi:hypothetical protein
MIRNHARDGTPSEISLDGQQILAEVLGEEAGPVSVWNPGFLAVLILFIVTFAAAQESGSRKFAVKPLPLPGTNGLVMLDYFAYDYASRRLWVPAANTGSVDVIDTTTDQIKRVEGFSVAQVELRGKLRQPK